MLRLVFDPSKALGLCHIGVVKTLFEAQLLPRIISGSSVGSIIASVVCVKADEELPFLFQPDNLEMVNKFSNDKDVFEAPQLQGFGYYQLNRLFHHGNRIDLLLQVFFLMQNFWQM